MNNIMKPIGGTDAQERARERLSQAAFRKGDNEYEKIANEARAKDDDIVFRPEGRAPLRWSDLSDSFKNELGRLESASERLEAVLLKEMFGAMERSVSRSSEGGAMTGLAKEMFHQSLAEELSMKNHVGMADVLFKQLSKNMFEQEIAKSALSNIDTDKTK